MTLKPGKNFNSDRFLLVLVLVVSLIFAGSIVSAFDQSSGTAAAADQDTIKASGNNYALLVGLSKYQNPHNDLLMVSLTTGDVMISLIRDCDYSASRITVLTNEQATESGIMSALGQMSARVGPDDTVVFYYGGHGGINADGSTYLYPYDGQEITAPELKSALDGIRCKKVLVILDACYSGGMIKGGTKKLVTASQIIAGNDNISEADRFSQDFISTFESRNSITQSPAEQQKALSGNKYVAIAAAKSDEYSNGVRGYTAVSGAVFTRYFVEGMTTVSADTNHDNWISAEEAFNYASPRTTSFMYDNAKAQQHPVMYDGDLTHDFQMALLGPVGGGDSRCKIDSRRGTDLR